MPGYTGIVDVSSRIVEILQENLCPELIRSPESIGLCSPDDNGNFVLGVHLYDIRENDEYINTSMTSVNSGIQRYPSTYLSLQYMITVYSTADIKYRAAEEQRILGRVIQVLRDNSVMGNESESGTGLDWVIRLMKLPAEEKVRMWNYRDKAIRTSLYYKVAPVEIESARTREISRVTRAEITVKE